MDYPNRIGGLISMVCEKSLDDEGRMIEINYQKPNPQGGILKGKLRIIGKDLFFLIHNSPYAQQLIQNLQSRGAVIEKDSRNKWVKADMFSNQKGNLFKIAGKEFNIEEVSDQEIESILGDFYYLNFQKAGFACEMNHG